MLWFKHDTNASQDAKLQNVLLDYGLEGYGLYWYCIEMIAGKVDANNLTFSLEHDARIIARNVGSTVQKVEEMMKYFVSIGLFECSNNTITCLKIAKRLDQSMTSNPAMRKMISQIRDLNSHDGVMIESCKNRIEENRIDNNVTPPKGGEVPPKKPKQPNVDYSVLQMTDEQVEEVKRIRKQTKGVISQRAINQLAKECDLSRRRGFSNDDILNEWTTRGWRSYKDEWNRGKPSGTAKPQAQKPAQRPSLDDEINELRNM